MEFIIKDTTLQEFEALEAQMRASHTGPEEIQKTWNSLHTFFVNSSLEDEKKYRFTFFRIYTELTFRLFGTLEKVQLPRIFSRQIPNAIMLDLDVWEKFLWYLGINAKDPKEMSAYYTQIRDAFLSSRAFVGMDKEKMLTVADVVEQVKLFEKNDSDSLARADFFARLRDAMYSKDPQEQKYFVTPPDEMVDKFIGLINFFLGVQPSRIAYIVDGFLFPENYDGTAPNVPPPFVEPRPGLENVEEVIPNIEAARVVLEGEESDTAVQEADSVEEEKPRDASVDEPTGDISYEEIKEMIDEQFPKDETGQYQNLEGVFGMLEQLADQYNTPSIKELLYFDEKSGGFVWKNSL